MTKKHVVHCPTLNTVANAVTKSTDNDVGVCATIETSSWAAWLQLAAVVSLSASVSLMWLSASSAPLSASIWMGVSLTRLNWLATMTPICNSIFSLFTGWSYERFGIKTNLIYAGVLNMLGCWVRCIAIFLPVQQRYAIIMVGQCISSLGAPFVYNVSAKLASVWFAPKHRGIANALASLSVGTAIAPLLIPKLAPSPEGIPKMWVVIAVIATAIALPLPFLPRNPHKIPSISAGKTRSELIRSVKCLLTRLDYWCILIAFTTNTGMGFAISSIIIEAILPYGYTEQEAGICASVIVFSGIFGGAMYGYWMGKTAQHLMLIKLLMPMVLFTYIMFLFQIIPNALGAVMVVCILNGFFTYAVLPIYIELACELFYPISEAVNSSLLWAVSTVGTIVFIAVADALREGADASPPNNMSKSMIALAIIFFIGSLPCYRLKGELKRLAVDQEKE